MAHFDIFSRRKNRSPSASADVYHYDIPHPLRIQLLTSLDDARGRIYERTIPEYRMLGTEGVDIFAQACLALRRELGLGRLTKVKKRVSQLCPPETQVCCDEFTAFVENCEAVHVLDAVEIVMKFIEDADRNHLLDPECDSDTVATEINRRFLDHGVGYQYQSGRIIVATNSVLHSEVLTPALILLSDPRFRGANEEFLKAHEHYRHGRLPECLVDCLKAFESTLKIICDLKQWRYKSTDAAKVLIDICLTNNLVPTFTQQQLTSLRTLLESGVPTLRNKQAGHGQGATPNQVSRELTRFGLHLTASAILLLVESFLASKS